MFTDPDSEMLPDRIPIWDAMLTYDKQFADVVERTFKTEAVKYNIYEHCTLCIGESIYVLVTFSTRDRILTGRDMGAKVIPARLAQSCNSIVLFPQGNRRKISYFKDRWRPDIFKNHLHEKQAFNGDLAVILKSINSMTSKESSNA